MSKLRQNLSLPGLLLTWSPLPRMLAKDLAMEGFSATHKTFIDDCLRAMDDEAARYPDEDEDRK